MTRTEEFEELRPLLFAIAYRILGSVSEAEDAVQETWLRYEASPTQPTSTKAFLSAVVTRISIERPVLGDLNDVGHHPYPDDLTGEVVAHAVGGPGEAHRPRGRSTSGRGSPNRC